MIRLAVVLALAVVPAACGKKGNPVPPPGAEAVAPAAPAPPPEVEIDPGLDIDEVGG